MTQALLVLGGGPALYREYVLRAVSTRYPVVLIQPTPLTWHSPYVVDHAVARLDQIDDVRTAVDGVSRRHELIGVLTYEETSVELAAMIAAELGLPHLNPEAARRCRDKLSTRQSLEKAGVPSARYRLAEDLRAAKKAARKLGYPVVVKPRALAGSMAVVKVHNAAEVAAAFTAAAVSRFPGARKLPGVLVEEYLDGPEISVDSIVFDGETQSLNIARKQVGFDPYFEEVGHFVSTDEPLPEEAEVKTVVAAAHRALGVDRAITHVELRLTPDGPRIVEVNARLGGDLIPLLGRLASGVDLPTAAADIAAGVRPRIENGRHGAAAVRFFYPSRDARVRSLGLAPEFQPPAWLDRVAWQARPGDELRLPPRGFLSRLGVAVVTGRDISECNDRLDQVQSALVISLEELDGCCGTSGNVAEAGCCQDTAAADRGSVNGRGEPVFTTCCAELSVETSAAQGCGCS